MPIPSSASRRQRTSDFVARKLADFGCEVFRGIGKTGVVGRLRAGNSQRSIGLRADMDALPIDEATNLRLPLAECTGACMPAAMTGIPTMLLGAARYLAETRNFDGTVHLIFQPAEEGLGGGAAMVEDGLFERFPCDAIFGMHNRPGLAVGKFQIRPGPMMAGGAYFDIAVTGRGAHGARPESGIDPVVAASHIATALQTIVSRNVRPLDTAVVSVTQIHAGEAYNVIPERAVMRGTARCFTPRDDGADRSATCGASPQASPAVSAPRPKLDFRIIFPPLVNDAEAARFIADVRGRAGRRRQRQPRRRAGHGVGGFLLHARTAARRLHPDRQWRRRQWGGGGCEVHNPGYDFNDAALPLGASLFARLVERKLAPG